MIKKLIHFIKGKWERHQLCKTCQNIMVIGNYGPCYYCKFGECYEYDDGVVR